ncbi:tyrosine-type recombinase/integrase [Photobacterium sagamiensis]|uniref:tyrosine-type recombinase/integrase n=1 Tax=Photobacterium sagamiensis TaxID=2910241 RepID=UPI003D11DCB8
MITKARAQARTLTPKEIKHGIRIAGVRQQPERNQLVLYLSHAACLRITEIAQIRPYDILTKRGELRESFVLPAAFGKGKAKARRVWLTHQKLRVAINTYCRYRLENSIGLGKPDEYRGLAPKSPLIRSNRGGAYALVAKRRRMKDYTFKYYGACDGLERLMRSIYVSAGLKGASSHSGRRSTATNLNELGVLLGEIQKLLGHSDYQQTLTYIDIRPARRADMVIGVI